jgi:hypothetical protein
MLIWYLFSIAQGSLVVTISVLSNTKNGGHINPKTNSVLGKNQLATMVYHNLTLGFYIAIMINCSL